MQAGVGKQCNRRLSSQPPYPVHPKGAGTWHRCLTRRNGLTAQSSYRGVAARVGLQSFTFEGETDFELACLQAEIDALTDIRDKVQWKSADDQVPFLAVPGAMD